MLTPHPLSTPFIRCHQNAAPQITSMIRTTIQRRHVGIQADIDTGNYDVVFAAESVHWEAKAVGRGPVIFVSGFVVPVYIAVAAGFVEDPVEHGLSLDG